MVILFLFATDSMSDLVVDVMGINNYRRVSRHKLSSLINNAQQCTSSSNNEV